MPAPFDRRAIKGAVDVDEGSGRVGAVRAAGKTVEYGFNTVCRYAEHGSAIPVIKSAVASFAADGRRTVERSVNVDQRRFRLGAVGSVGKAVEYLFRAFRRDAKNRTASDTAPR